LYPVQKQTFSGILIPLKKVKIYDIVNDLLIDSAILKFLFTSIKLKVITMYKILQTSILLMLITLMMGCAGVITKPEPPKVSIAGFKLLKVKVFEQQYQLRLRLKNPNAFPLPLSNLNFQLYLNDKEFTSGKSKQATTIPALGEAVIEIEVASNLMDIFKGWGDWKEIFKSHQNFNYRLFGTLNIVDWAPSIPFERKGEISLEKF